VIADGGDLRPGHVAEVSFGPDVTVGKPIAVARAVVRVTAPNPSFMTGPGTNTYLVGTDLVAVIDPGPVIATHLDAIEAAAADRGSAIRWIALTHHHADHAPAAGALAERTGAVILAFGHRDGVQPDRRVAQGFGLDGPDFRLVALHTPGHASDHLCWLLEGERLLFSGDHVMQGSTVVIRPPDGNMVDYLSSLDGLTRLRPALRAIAPGHGRLIDDPVGVIEAIVRHRLDREEQVAAALRTARTATVGELLALVYKGLQEPLVPVARHTLVAHLEKLAHDGRARPLLAVGDDTQEAVEASRWEALA